MVKEWRDKAYCAESECSIDDLTRLRVPSILNEGGSHTFEGISEPGVSSYKRGGDSTKVSKRPGKRDTWLCKGRPP